MKLDLSRLGDWSTLPFFTAQLPQIETRLAQEDGPVFPPAPQVFAALERCQPDATRVVILGQDPYHTPGKADGLAFSIPNGFPGRLDSLGNIIKELQDDLKVTRTQTALQDWADQGVLLLNTSLTVPQGKAGGHKALGWAALVRDVLERLADRPRAYVLWGSHAQKVAAKVDPTRNLKIETAHPSPLSAYRGFFGSRPFSTVNQWLKDHGDTEINWTQAP
ncbi:uracil-DNA glycosylase [Aliishimia ponticola]|uniref:Uracil-DNA glycosylase n=1 Tax=Aliishimia ponticola TaxID=2499833 RepID=A0A4S4NKP9_9RHOB|nr:uracil-DNA glycosylase [Aliishimia ponticola]THH38851.1 uracil-DNA glycosylase [Aliishimia ponticola]